MVTISSILGSWLNNSHDYSEGVDIFQRLSKHQAKISFFLRFKSDMTANELQKEIDRLYSESKQAQAVQGKEPEPTDTLMQTLRSWLDMSLSTDDNWNYVKGIDLLETITGDDVLAAFFSHHNSRYGRVQLKKALQDLLVDLENIIARKQKNTAPLTIVGQLGAWLMGDQNYFDGVALFSKSTSDSSLVSFFQSGDSTYRRMRLKQEMERLFNELRTREQQQQSTATATPTPAGPHSTKGAADTSSPVESELATQEHDDPDSGHQNGTSTQTDTEQDDSTIPDAMLAHVIDNLRKSLSKLRQREQTPARLATIRMNETCLETLLQRKNSLTQAN